MLGILALAFLIHQTMALMDVNEFNDKVLPNCFENGMPTKSHAGVSVENFIHLVDKYERKHPGRNIVDVIMTFLNEFNYDGLVIPLSKAPNDKYYARREPYAVERLEIVEKFLDDFKNIKSLSEDDFTMEERCHLFFSLSHTVYETELETQPEIRPEERTTTEITTTELSRDNDQNTPNLVTVEQGVASFEGDETRAISLGEVLYGILGSLIKREKPLKDLVISEDNNNGKKFLSSYIFSLAALISAKEIYDDKVSIVDEENRWNSAECTKDYILKESDKIFTKANLLGALDGFIMGESIENKDDRSFKLSQLLRMYYSRQGFSVKTSGPSASFCSRESILENPTFKEELDNQIYNYIWINHLKTKLNVKEVVESKANAAKIYFFNSAKKIVNPTKVEKDICADKSEMCETPSDVVFVLDERSHFDDQKLTVAKVINKINIGTDESSVMVLINSKDSNFDPKKIVDTTNNKAMASCGVVGYGITKDENSMDDGSVLEAINRTLMNIEQEKISLPGVPSKVVIYYNYESAIENVLLKRKIENARRLILNKHKGSVVVGVGENKENLKNFISDPALNIFDHREKTNIVVDLAKRICKVPAQFQYQECSKRSDNTNEHLMLLNPDRVQYWQMQPKYFYKSFGYKLRFKPENGNIRVCFNRVLSYDKAGSNCLQTSEEKPMIEFSRRDPCKGFTASTCNPFYFEIYGLDDSSLTRCPLELDEMSSEKPVCKTLRQIKVTFTHEGLACSSALRQIGSLYQFMLAFFVTLYIISQKS